MSNRKWFLALVTVAAWTACSALAQTTPTPQPRQHTFPPVGLGSTETAEINVVNVASDSSTGTAASCTGSISFLSSSGAVLGTATPFTVTASQAFSARLLFSATGATGNRAVIRGVVQLTPSTTTPRPPVRTPILIADV